MSLITLDASKKTIFLTLLAILFIASTVYISLYSGKSTTLAKEGELLSVFSKTTSEQRGLLDVRDGETRPNWKVAVFEQLEKDDPTGALLVADDANQENLNDSSNITAQYAKNVYAATAVLGQETELTEEDRARIASAIFVEEASKASAKQYLPKDIAITNAGKSEIKQYGNKIATYAMNAIVEGSEYYDIPLFEEYAKTKDPSVLEKIDTKIKIVTTLRDNLLRVTVPSSALLFHLSAVNGVESYLQTLINMRAFEKDALRATIGAHDYVTVYQTMFSSINALSDYFDAQNIVYLENEAGYLFTKGLLNQTQ